MNSSSPRDDEETRPAEVTRRTLLVRGGAGVAALAGAASISTQFAWAKSAGRPTNGGNLTIGLSNEPPNLDPHQNSTAIGATVTADTFDTLLVAQTGGKLVPSLATNWSFSTDGKQLTLNLRQGVLFQDGAPFDAAAMKESFDRMVDPATKSGLAGSLLGPYKGSTVAGTHTVQVLLSSPYAPLLRNLSQVFTAPVSPTAIKKYGLGVATNPVGTGPFSFKEWVQKDHISFVRNPAYHWAPAFFGFNGPPALQTITWKIVPEDATRIATLRDGETNMIESFPPAFAAQFKSDSTYALDIKMRTGLPFSFMVNTQNPPCDELAVRQAMSYGIDKNAISRALTFGLNPPARGPLSPVTFAYWSGVEQYYPFNAAKAKALLDQAGWKVGSDGIRVKNGRRLQLQFWTLSDVVAFLNVAQAFQAQMKSIGIDITIVSLARAAWGAGVFAGKHHLTVQIFALPDPSVLSINFNSKNIGNQGFNWSRYANPKLDSLLNQGDVELDTVKRQQLYYGAQKIIMDNAITIPVYENMQIFGRLATVQDVTYIEGGQPLFYSTYVS